MRIVTKQQEEELEWHQEILDKIRLLEKTLDAVQQISDIDSKVSNFIPGNGW